MLDANKITDAVEGSSLSFSPQHVDIYSSSWGPTDNGRTVDGPARLAKKAFLDGVTKGRGGKGSIYVWASGNGGSRDNCNCDGYAVSPYTVSIGSVSESGSFPWYAEECSSNLATTYSSGSSRQRRIISTDLHHGCTDHHTGTSAAAPMAAGIIALALQVNPNLTWRDVQYIIVYSSNPSVPRDDHWITNGAGLKVSLKYGFGLMDAAALVNRARYWTNVPPRLNCTISVNLDQ
jgi:subtilisin family serine protease